MEDETESKDDSNIGKNIPHTATMDLILDYPPEGLISITVQAWKQVDPKVGEQHGPESQNRKQRNPLASTPPHETGMEQGCVSESGDT